MDFSIGDFEQNPNSAFSEQRRQDLLLSLGKSEWSIDFGAKLDFTDDAENFYLSMQDAGVKKFTVEESVTLNKPKVSFVVQKEAVSTKYSKEDTTNSTYELLLDECSSSEENFLVKKRLKDSPNRRKDKGCKLKLFIYSILKM